MLNLYVTLMLPIKLPLNPTYRLGGDVVWSISRWPPWQPSWKLERNDFSNSESLCCSDASNQVLAQSNLWSGRRYHLKNFKGYRNRMILALLNLSMSLWCLPSSFGSIWLMVWEEMSFEEFQDGHDLGGDVVWRISRDSWNDFSNSESLCHCDASHEVSAQSD